MRIKYILLISLLLVYFAGIPILLAENLKIWVNFTDKNHNSYSIYEPETFLSENALFRRIKQNIAIDSLDLPVSKYYIQNINAIEGIQVRYTSKWLNGALLVVTDSLVLESVQALEFIASSENVKPKSHDPKKKSGIQNYKGDTLIDSFLDFAYYHNNYFNLDYGSASNQIEMLQGQYLHSLGFKGEGIKIALLDAGFSNVDSIEAFNHLWNENRIIGYRDFVNPEGDVFREHRHGTVVLSVMAADLPGMYMGAAPKASFLLLRSEDVNSEFRIEEYNWLAAAEYADSMGVDIINSSLGYTTFDAEEQNYVFSQLDGETTVVARAANIAFDKGILVVNSAGNYGNRNWRYIGSPADSFGAMSVGAINQEGERASFSSVGPSTDGRVKPDIMAQGAFVSVVDNDGNINNNAMGTSFSAPLISALSACLWQKYYYQNNKQVRKAIIQSADRYLNPDSLYGHGIPNFESAAALLQKEFNLDLAFSVFPNPITFHSKIAFFLKKPQQVNVQIYSASGMHIHSFATSQTHSGKNIVPLANHLPRSLSPGIYFIRLEHSGHSQMVKAIKL